jgi:hypothetical protein
MTMPDEHETENKTKPKPRGTMAATFLGDLRPERREYVITAIPPEGGATTTRTFTDLEEARQFIVRYNDQKRQNLYYTSALCRAETMNSKPRKADIAVVCYLHVDADPSKDETPAEFKKRMLARIAGFKPAPTFVVDSGNGLQFLWELQEPVDITGEDVIRDIEARNYALAAALGADPSTRNIDRLLRLPGTTNYPNTKKQKDGRVECRARCLTCNDKSYPLSAFPPHEETADDTARRGPDQSGSGHGRRFMEDCKRRGFSFAAACEAILADSSPAGEWARRVDDRQLRRAWTANDRHSQWTGYRGPNAPQGEKEYVLTKAEDVIIRSLQWLWKGRLIRGGQELMTGLKGLGKSQVQCSLIACATTKRQWPDGAPATEPGNVVMVTAEDTKDQVVVPRLMAAGADLSRITFLEAIKQDDKERMFLLGEDIEVLEQVIKDIGNVCLVAIDPITVFMGKMNPNSVTDVRGQLGPLAKLAERTDVAFTTITHPPKHATQSAIDGFIHSGAFVHAARVAHMCIPEMKNDINGPVPTGRNLFTHVDGNLSKRLPALAYWIEEELVQRAVPPGDRLARIQAELERVETVRVLWAAEPVDITANEALSATTHKGPSLPEQADSFLRELLAAGPLDNKAVYAAGHKKGFSRDQLKRASKRLSVNIIKPERRNAPWEWALPEDDSSLYTKK